MKGKRRPKGQSDLDLELQLHKILDESSGGGDPDIKNNNTDPYQDLGTPPPTKTLPL